MGLAQRLLGIRSSLPQFCRGLEGGDHGTLDLRAGHVEGLGHRHRGPGRLGGRLGNGDPGWSLDEHGRAGPEAAGEFDAGSADGGHLPQHDESPERDNRAGGEQGPGSGGHELCDPETGCNERREEHDRGDRTGAAEPARRGRADRDIRRDGRLGLGETTGGLTGERSILSFCHGGRTLQLLLQHSLLKSGAASGCLRTHLLRNLGGLGHDAECLLQPDRVALGREILATTQPGRHQIYEPEQRGERNDHARSDAVDSHSPTVRVRTTIAAD